MNLNDIKFESEPEYYALSVGQKGVLNDQKVFLKRPNERIESIQQIINEIVILRKCSHVPHTLQPIVNSEEPQILFPYIEKSLLDFCTQFNETQIIEIVIKPLLETLGQLHRLGIIHADIKAENIRINYKNQISLADFGKAVIAGKLNKNEIGSLPQHNSGDITISPRFDLYSVGVLAYQLAFGIHFMRDYQLKGRNFLNVPESKLFSEKFLKFIQLSTESNATERFSSAPEALNFLIGQKDIPEIKIEPYNLASHFETYLEFMKQVIVSSYHPLSRFDSYVGSCGEKYFERLSRWLKLDDKILIHLKENDKIIGVLEGSIKQSTGLISTLFIHKGYRRNGYAQLLEQEAFKFFRMNGCTLVTLNVAKENRDAILFYKKTSWIEEGDSNYPDAFAFSKKL